MKRKFEIEVDVPEEMDEEFIQLYMQLPPSLRSTLKTYVEGILLWIKLGNTKKGIKEKP